MNAPSNLTCCCFGGLWVEDEDGHKPAPRLPIGEGVELLRSDALAVAAREIPEDEPHHRVHVTSWLAPNAKYHAVPTPLDWPGRPDWRWTIDTSEDLAMARSAFRLFGEDALTSDYPNMVEGLDAHPEITGMNQHVEQNKLEEG